MELVGEWAMWNLYLFRLKLVLVSVQYRCTVWTKCTIGSETFFDPWNGTPW
jgi:hypothetical protein